MNQFEATTSTIEADETKKSLDQALLEFNVSTEQSSSNLNENESIEQFFYSHRQDPQFTLAIPIPQSPDSNKDKDSLIITTRLLRRAIFDYISKYIKTSFGNFDSSSQENALVNLKIDLGEKILNLRHAETSDSLEYLYIKFSNEGNGSLQILLMNPTTTHPDDMKHKYDEFGTIPTSTITESSIHGENLIDSLMDDKNTILHIQNDECPIYSSDGSIVAHQDIIQIDRNKF